MFYLDSYLWVKTSMSLFLWQIIIERSRGATSIHHFRVCIYSIQFNGSNKNFIALLLKVIKYQSRDVSAACYRSNHLSISGPIHHKSKYHNIITSSSFHQIDERSSGGPWEWRNKPVPPWLEAFQVSKFQHQCLRKSNKTKLKLKEVFILISVVTTLLHPSLWLHPSVCSQDPRLASKVTCQLYSESFVFICNPDKQM